MELLRGATWGLKHRGYTGFGFKVWDTTKHHESITNPGHLSRPRPGAQGPELLACRARTNAELTAVVEISGPK